MTQDGGSRTAKPRSSKGIGNTTNKTTGGSTRGLDLPSPSAKGTAKLTVAPQADVYAGDEEVLIDPPRPNTSIVRYNNSPNLVPQRSTSTQNFPATIPARRQQNQGATRDLPRPQRNTTQSPPYRAPERNSPPRPRKNVHWLFLVGIGMIAALILWVIGVAVVGWGTQRYNDVLYGNPRTYHTYAVVGHNDSKAHPSYFIAMNLNHKAIVVEFMGGDPAKSVNYVAPVDIVGDGSELAPVTVSFRDVTGDGKLDMVIDVHTSNPGDRLYVFINDGSKFRPPTSSDKLTYNFKRQTL